MQKNEQSLRNLWDTIERNDIYIYILRVQEEEIKRELI